MENRVWYKDKTYKFTMIALFTLMVFFTLSTWIMDGEVREKGAIFLFGGGMVVTTLLSFVLRNNR